MIVNADNNLFFDDTDSRCELVVLQLTGDKIKDPTKDLNDDDNWVFGKRIAFVRCIDKPTGHTKEYCGLYDESKKAESIENIMLSGAKFNEVLRVFGE